MIAAIDVHYTESSATAGAVVFRDFKDQEPLRSVTLNVPEVDEYISGQFFKRELPCILAVLDVIKEDIDIIIIDGYVDLEDNAGDEGRSSRVAGLGRHLYDALEGRTKIIGVAKTKYHGADAVELKRGQSANPLFITSAGMDPRDASEHIWSMYGDDRIPILLKEADRIAKRLD